jgi:hypothetical protein
MPRESFQSTEALLGFYETACKAGVIEQSENAELRFIAFAERARFRATSSPEVFFVGWSKGNSSSTYPRASGKLLTGDFVVIDTEARAKVIWSN